MDAPATEIKTGTGLVTLINVYPTTPETQGKLLDLMARMTSDAVVMQPGFVSANLHASRDGLRIVNYAQWESSDAFQAMRGDPACRRYMEEIEALTTPDVHVYDVVSTAHPATRISR